MIVGIEVVPGKGVITIPHCIPCQNPPICVVFSYLWKIPRNLAITELEEFVENFFARASENRVYSMNLQITNLSPKVFKARNLPGRAHSIREITGVSM